MPNHLPQHYEAHLETLWAKTKHQLPVDLQTDQYRDQIFKPQRWLRDGLLHQGYPEEFINGIEVGMTDWLVNLANLGPEQAGMSTFQYVRTFLLGLMNDELGKPQPQPIPSGAMSGGAEILGTAVVLNDNMKLDNQRYMLFAKGAAINGNAWISHLKDGTYLGIGWYVGDHKHGDGDVGLYWLESGDTCWETEVEAIHIEGLEFHIWQEFHDNAEQTTIQALRSRTIDGATSDLSATGQATTQ